MQVHLINGVFGRYRKRHQIMDGIFTMFFGMDKGQFYRIFFRPPENRGSDMNRLKTYRKFSSAGEEGSRHQRRKKAGASKEAPASGIPGAIRTRDLPLRRRTLYPAELRRQITASVLS